MVTRFSLRATCLFRHLPGGEDTLSQVSMRRLEVSYSRQVDLGGTGGHDGAPLVKVGKSVKETWASGP